MWLKPEAVARFALGVVLFSGVSLADINLSPSSANVSAAGGTGSVQVINTNSNSWTATSNQTWLRITSGASGSGNGTISYLVDGNPAAKTRDGVITVRNGSETDTFPVTQSGGVMSVSPSSANVQGSGGNGTLTITAHDSPYLQWTATSDQSWLTVTSISPANPTQGSGSVSWTAQPNSGAPRTGRITVLPRDGTGIVFVVNQEQGSGSISVSPSSLDLDATGGNGSIQVTASVQSITWNATSSQPWLVLSSASGTGTKTFQYLGAANPSFATRAATITVTASSGPAQTVSVTQTGGALTIAPSSASVGAGGGAGSVVVTSTSSALGWTAVSSQPWLTFTPPGATGTAAAYWTAAANASTTARSATITFDPAGVSGPNSKIFSVSQQGIGTDDFKVNPPTATAPAAASTGVLNVVSTVPSLTWSAASNQSWLHITSGSIGAGSGQIQYSVDVTNMATDRTAIITVTPAAGTPVTSTITQTGGVLTISPLSANPPPAGGTGSITITTSVNTLTWSASNTDPWLTITSATSGSGSATLNWAAQSNLTGSSRSAKIQITPNNGTPIDFRATQNPLEGILVSSVPSLAFSYQLGATPPADVQVVIRSTPSGLPFVAAASTISGGSWLTVLGTGPTPGVLTVSVNSGGLPIGHYDGNVAITSSSALNSPLNIPVTFDVVPQPVLTAQPDQVSFSFQQNGPSPAAQVITLSTSSGELDYKIAPNPGASWLTVVGSGPAPANLTVSVDPHDLGVGTYQTHIIVLSAAAGNSPFLIPVSLTVSAAPNLIPLPTSLSLTVREFDPPPAPISMVVGSSGTPLPFSVTTTSPWLTVTGGGTTPAVVQVSVNPTGLAVGTHQASLVFASNLAGNSPQLVPVTLTIQPGYRLTVDPRSLRFSLTQGGGLFSRQGSIGTATANLAVSSDVPTSFLATAETTTGGNWLSVVRLAVNQVGLTVSTTPSVLAVTATVGDLPPGVYAGSIILASSGVVNSPVIVPVSLTVSAQRS